MNKNYIPVLCCSGQKNEHRFCYNGQTIKFVASPQMLSQAGVIFQKPDNNISGENRTWRDLVLAQKHQDIVQAYCLYSSTLYREFYHEFGNRFYILSAGWGIIRADFKIPDYDITYSTAPNMPKYVRRRDNYGWNDINHLKEDSLGFDRDSEIILFAGADYVSPFCNMTQSIPFNKRILYKRANLRQRQGFIYEYYQTNRSTNWHYEAAEKFLNIYKKTNQVIP